MIEKMKKITAIVCAKDREELIKSFRGLGVLHVKHLREPRAEEVQDIETKIGKLDQYYEKISTYAERFSEEGLPGINEKEALELAERTEEYLKKKEKLKEKLENELVKKEWLEKWGGIEPADIKKIKETGINVALYEIPEKQFRKINSKSLREVSRSDGIVRAALIGDGQHDDIEFEEISLPRLSSSETEEAIASIRAELDLVEKELKKSSKNLPSVMRTREKLSKELEFARVKEGMQDEGVFLYVQGFCPEKQITPVKELCERMRCGLVQEEPDDPEETPTHITNPSWIDIIKPIFGFMNTLPGYDEYDISLIFLVFFSVFFAMLIGDAGYGLIFISAAYFARRKFKTAPREPFFLVYLLGWCTVLWGAVTGTWFGVEQLARAPYFRAVVIPSIGSFSGADQNFIIFLCFIIGAVHLTLAHVLKMSRVLNSVKAGAEVGWVLIIWGMFFAAGQFVLGREFPSYGGYLLAGGALSVLFCSEPEKGLIKGALSTLSQLPLSIISSFSDVVSYLRLFAVGYATVVVADSFNKMAFSAGVPGIAGNMITAAILFMGHTLNIVLGCMAVIVHGIRLNMLEFSGHLGMQWTGKKYEPFKE